MTFITHLTHVDKAVPMGLIIKKLGKETIDTYNTGESRGRETSHSLNYQKLGKDVP